MFKLFNVSLAVALLVLSIYSLALAQEETLTISTYYPSPYGSYNEFKVASNTYLAYSSGSVGIGTIAPGSAKLAVIGGNVGIGTTGPMRPLHIVGEDPGTKPAIIIEEYSVAGGAPDIFFYKGAGTVASPQNVDVGHQLGGLTYCGYSEGAFRTSSSVSAHVESVSATAVRSGITFVTTNDSDVLSERVRIDRNGNVGIGTASPTSKLQVVGLPVYANNAAAIAGGLTAGALYRTGSDPDQVCVVH